MLAIPYLVSQTFVLIIGQQSPIVTTNLGKIQGFSASSANGNPYFGFLNIPYGIPPVGNLRFTYPQPYGAWTETRLGNASENACPQIALDTGEYLGDEDCLYLNIYVPQTPFDFSRQNLPVMVYFYGGGFLYGSGRYIEYGPEKFMDYPVILVIPNYRLGPLGFLSTNDSSAYGNYAMLDAILALKWVRDNIHSFGGDPTRVTIFGDSAGSGTVVHLVLSQLSKGLFSRAIDESGSALSYWAVQPKPLEHAQHLAKQVNCPYENSGDLVDCLRTKSAIEIVTAVNISQTAYFFPTPFAPVVEAPGGPGFLTEEPIDIILQGKIGNKVPMIIGHTRLEGYTLFSNLKTSFKYNGSEYFEKQFASQLPLYTPVQPYMTDAVEAIENYYNLKHLDLNNETVFVQVYSEIIGDAMMTAPTTETANLFSESGLPVNAYIYTHVGEVCLALLFHSKCGKYSSHGDEVFYQFRYFNFANASNSDKENTKVINTLWTTFAAHKDLYLRPGVKWPFYDTKDPKYTLLNVTPTIGYGTLSNATEFWMVTIPEIVKKYPSN